MNRAARAPRAWLVSLVVCLSLLGHLPLSVAAGTSSRRLRGKAASPAGKGTTRQAPDAADLPDLDEVRSRPRHEPRAVAPVPSTRRRCPPRNPRCNGEIDAPARPAPTPASAPAPSRAGVPAGGPTYIASVAAPSPLTSLATALNGGLPVLDLPWLDYFSAGGGFAVSDSDAPVGKLPALYPTAAPLAQAPPNASAFVAQSVPTLMQVGRRYNVTVTMRNTGSNPWTASGNYNLGSQNPQDNATWGAARAGLPAPVAPGAEVTITFNVTAPAAPGAYNFQWRMVQDGVEWFGAYTPNVAVQVASAAAVGHWKFDEGSGTAAADSSGNGNTGTLHGGPTWAAGAVGSGALDFDGADDRVGVNASASLESAVNDFTLSFWANPRATHEIDPETTTGVGGASGQRYAWWPRSESGLDAGAGVSVGTNGVSVYEHAADYMPATLVYHAPITGWTHFAVVYRNKQPKLYVNGALVRTGLASPRARVRVGQPDIGGNFTGYFNGLLDDVRLHNGALTAGEISALAAPPTRPAAHWKLDEGSGATASDASGNGHTGTLQGGAAWAAGKVGAGAASFDGADDYVQVGAQPGLVMTSAATFSAWLFPTGTGSGGVGGGIIINREGEYELARFADGTLQWAFANSSPGWLWINTGAVAPLNQWTHFAVVYDNGVVKTYANGQLVHTYNGAGAIGDVDGSQNDFRIGGRQAVVQNFQGRIDDVKVYKTTSTVQEVAALAGGQGEGLTGEYFDNDDFTAHRLTRTDRTLDFDWGAGSPDSSLGPDLFSVRWTGMVVPRFTETYTFHTTTDDGVRLWIDGHLVIDKWVDQAPIEWTGQVSMEAGRRYAVRMEFFERWGGASARLRWSSPSQAKEVIPQSQLYGCWKETGQFAREFYQGALARQPYAGELNDWSAKLAQAQGDAQLLAEAQALGVSVFTSAEYAARTRTDGEYVSDLYRAFMQRAPDQSGLNHWTGYVAACGSDQGCRAVRREDLLGFFGGSGEFGEKVRALCGTSAASPANGGAGYNFSTARLDPDNRTGGGGVDPLSRNFNWGVPLVGLPGRAGLDLGLTLSYNSLVWTKDAGGVTFDADRGFPSPGFRLGFPVIQPKFYNPRTGKHAYLLISPSGGRTELRQVGENLYESADSSHLQLTDAGGMSLLAADGTRLSFSLLNGEYRCYEVKDRNGNYLSVAHYADGRIDKVIDTLGRAVTFNYDTYQNLTSITQPWRRDTEATPQPTQDEAHEWATFGYENLTLRPSFSDLAVMGEQPGAVIPVLSQVGLADGSYYKFSYNQWGQVWKVTHYAADSSPAVDNHVLSYVRLDLPGSDLAAATPQADCPRFTEERVWVENGVMNKSAEATTAYSPWAPAMASCDVTVPDGTVRRDLYETTGWKKGLTKESHVLSGGQTKKWTVVSWEHDGAADAAYPTNPRVFDTTVNSVNEANNSEINRRRTSTTYQTFSPPTGGSCTLPQEVTEYKSDAATALRTTRTEYNLSAEYTGQHIIGLPASRLIYEGTSAAGALASKVEYVYDDDQMPGYLQPLPSGANASQHDRSAYGATFRWRGNLNRVRRYDVKAGVSTFVESQTGYNVTGTAAFTKDPLGHKTSVGYDDAFFQNVNRTSPDPQSRLKTFAYPTAVTNPDDFTATSSYNYDMGIVRQVQTPLPNVTTNQPGPLSRRLYDAAGRVVLALTEQNGASTEWVYTARMDIVQIYALGDPNKKTYSAQVLDGAGRVRATSRYLPPPDDPGTGTYTGNYAGQIFDYDVMGRPARRSNPAEVTGAWAPTGEDSAGWVYTLQSYDWKGRPLVTTHEADGTTFEYKYGGCGCAGGEVVVTRDEVGRRRRVVYDVLGRVWKAQVLSQQHKNTDFTVSPAEVPYSTTTNTYDVLNHLTEVRVRAESNGAEQVTSMGYDGHGRLKSRHLPQQDEGKATVYSYNADDTLDVVTDARGATTTYSYLGNKRHLVTGVTYGAPEGGTGALPLTFTYDAAGNRTRMDDGQGWITYTYDAFSRMASETRHFSALNRSYTLSYSAYNLAGQLKTMTDPFGAEFNYSYDRAGQLKEVGGSSYAGVTNYAKDVQYRAWGAVKSAAFGDNSSETIRYDKRMRPKEFRLATNDHFSSAKLREDFAYYADGRLMSITDLDDGPGTSPPSTWHFMSRTYTYDLKGRVLSGVGVPPATDAPKSPFDQTYTYDEFDNLKTRSGSVGYAGPMSDTANYANNRRNGWSYDADGRLTLSPVNSASNARAWTYDAAGRLSGLTETSGSGALTAVDKGYDGDGLGVKDTVTGGSSPGTSYAVRSSILGGAVVTKLNASGGKDITYVPAMKLVSPMQTHHVGSTTERVTWNHRDALGLTEAGFLLASYDPLGNYIQHAPPQGPSQGVPPPSTNVAYGPSYSWSGAGSSFANGSNFSTGCMAASGNPQDCSSLVRREQMHPYLGNNLPGAHHDMAWGEHVYAGHARAATISRQVGLREPWPGSAARYWDWEDPRGGLGYGFTPPEPAGPEPIWVPGSVSDSTREHINRTLREIAGNKECVQAFKDAKLEDPNNVLARGYVLGTTTSVGALDKNNPGYGITSRGRDLVNNWPSGRAAGTTRDARNISGGRTLTIYSANNFTVLGALIELPTDIGIAATGTRYRSIDFLVLHELVHAAGADDYGHDGELDKHFGFSPKTYLKIMDACLPIDFTKTFPGVSE